MSANVSRFYTYNCVLLPLSAAGVCSVPKPADEASVFRVHPAFKFGEQQNQQLLLHMRVAAAAAA